MKLLLDEMLPRAVAEQLRSRGHDVIAVTEREDLRSASDQALFDLARADGRVIVTENIEDFRVIAAALARQGGVHAGLVFTANSAFPRGRPRTIGRLVTALEALLVGDSDVGGREVWLSGG